MDCKTERLSAQITNIKGFVKSESGALGFASISLVDSEFGVISDENGYFEFEVDFSGKLFRSGARALLETDFFVLTLALLHLERADLRASALARVRVSRSSGGSWCSEARCFLAASIDSDRLAASTGRGGARARMLR